jgi:type II secretion system protein N
MAAIVFFLYYLFPSGAAKDLLSSYLKKNQPDYHLQVEQIRLAIPPGVRFDTVEISHKKEAWAALEQFDIRPDYLTLFTEKKSFLFKGNAYKGGIKGTIDIIPGSVPYLVGVDADIRDIQLDDISRLHEILGTKVRGNLAGTFQFQDGRGVERKADIQLNISNAGAEITHALINQSLDQINFRSIEAVIAVKEQTLELKQCKAVGNQADGELSGVIRFRRPFAKSRLDFRGTVKLHHSLLTSLKNIIPGNLFQMKKNENGGLPFKLYGTIEKPKISLR